MTNILIGSSSANNKYFYDFAGNLTSNIINSTINKYYYNAQNKLCKILCYTKSGNMLMLFAAYHFTYDSQNRRIILSHNQTWRYTIHDGNIPIAEFNTQYEFGKVFVRGIGIAEGTGDVIAELYLYAYRVYDPIAGRWSQRAPIDYQDSINQIEASNLC